MNGYLVLAYMDLWELLCKVVFFLTQKIFSLSAQQLSLWWDTWSFIFIIKLSFTFYFFFSCVSSTPFLIIRRRERQKNWLGLFSNIFLPPCLCLFSSHLLLCLVHISTFLFLLARWWVARESHYFLSFFFQFLFLLLLYSIYFFLSKNY